MPGLGLSIPDLTLRQRTGPAAAAFDFTAGVLPAGARLTRAGPAGFVGPNGVLSVAAADTARFDCDPVGGLPRGLLIEAAGGNAVAWSEDFDNATGWAVGPNTIIANAATAPSGAAAADLIVPSTANGTHGITAGGSYNHVAGMRYVRSLYAKAAGYRFLRLSASPSAFPGNGRSAVYDLVAGTALGESGVATGIEAAGGGWFRVWSAITASASAAAVAVTIAIQQSFVAAPEGFAGDGTSGILAFGAQLEVGALPSSYTATTSAAAARAADALALDWAGRGVADGSITVRYGFDDGSTQDVTTMVAGGSATVPTTLDRARLRRAERV